LFCELRFQVDKVTNLADKTAVADCKPEGTTMNLKRYAAAVASLMVLSGLMGINSAAAQVLKWKTVIGIKESGDVVGVGSGAISGGAPWETLGGSVKVNLNSGSVKFDVDGLILAVGTVFELGATDFSTPLLSGLPIGTPAGIAEVKGTLVCNVTGDQGANSVSVDTPVVPLDAQGNANFNGSFSSGIPSVCSTNAAFDDAFLIRIGSGAFANAWIAFGAVLTVK
jgi:hypothetical protein